jgi:hypothetical protein
MTGDIDQGENSGPFDGVAFLDLPEPEKFKRFDGLKRDLMQLQQRFKDRLSFERLSLAEQYRRGGLSIACYFQFGAGLALKKYGFLRFVDAKSPLDIQTDILCLIFKANAANFLDGHDGDQQVVFVRVVEGADRPEANIASVVDAYVVGKQLGKIGEGFFYSSIRGMGTRIIPVFCHRERDLITPYTEIRNTLQNLNRDMVERGTQVVNDVAYDKATLGWRPVGRNDLDELLSGLAVCLDLNTAKITLEEVLKGRIKLLDVAVGPLDL